MYLSNNEIQILGFKSYGRNVLISSKASFYGCSKISIGNNVRIDDFCILSAGDGGISIGNNVHIACYTSLIGNGHISLGDYSNLSSRVAVYTSSDDYSGNFMTNPTIPEKFKKVDTRSVIIERHCIIGAGTVILPGVKLHEGCSIGAMSLVKKDCQEFGIYAGIPAKFVKKRFKKVLEIEKTFLAGQKN